MQPHGEGEFGGPRDGPSSLMNARGTGIGAAIDQWKSEASLARAFVLDETLPGSEARYVDIPSSLAEPESNKPPVPLLQ